MWSSLRVSFAVFVAYMYDLRLKLWNEVSHRQYVEL